MKIITTIAQLCRNRGKPDAACRQLRRCRVCGRPLTAVFADRVCTACAATVNVKGVRHV